ncbi:MAG: hypothetical protein QM831_36025 [Kofleriaceae bacterium]
MRAVGILLLIVVELVLFISTFLDTILFVGSHHELPENWDEVMVLAMVINVAALGIAYSVSRRAAKVVCGGAVLVTLGTYVAYAAYSSTHPSKPDIFDGHVLGMVETFHHAFALPVFLTLGFIAAIFGIRAMTSPHTAELARARVVR